MSAFHFLWANERQLIHFLKLTNFDHYDFLIFFPTYWKCFFIVFKFYLLTRTLLCYLFGILRYYKNSIYFMNHRYHFFYQFISNEVIYYFFEFFHFRIFHLFLMKSRYRFKNSPIINYWHYFFCLSLMPINYIIIFILN